jgi:hypothetical protein
MTLVLSLLTPTHALQASDRKVVSISRGKIIEEDDQRNKAVLFRDRWAFGFTGLAELGRDRRTDLWLADALSRADQSLAPGEHDPRVLFEAVARRATEEFRRAEIVRLPSELRRHAFVGVCWGRFPDAASPLPYLALISNFHDRRAGELGRATDGFDFFINRADPGVSTIYWTGERLDRSGVRAMKSIERLNPRAPGFAAAAIRLMVDQVRSVASRKRTVGRGVLTMTIPGSVIEAARAERFILHGPPDPDHVTFLYFAPGSEDPTVHGPTYVGEGAVMSSFQAWHASGGRLAEPSRDS